jgi:hypothetical protein
VQATQQFERVCVQADHDLRQFYDGPTGVRGQHLEAIGRQGGWHVGRVVVFHRAAPVDAALGNVAVTGLALPGPAGSACAITSPARVVGQIVRSGTTLGL